MLKLLLPLLLCLPSGLRAQTWNIAATGGLLFNSRTSAPFSDESAPNRLCGAASLQISRKARQWEAGLGVSYRRYAVRHSGTIVLEPHWGQPASFLDYDYLETFPTIAITPFLRRHFSKGKMDYYLGAAAGITTLPYGAGIGLMGEHIDHSTSPAGITAGIHAGCNYGLSKRWSLRSEASIDDMWLKGFHIQSLLLSGGLQYRLN